MDKIHHASVPVQIMPCLLVPFAGRCVSMLKYTQETQEMLVPSLQLQVQIARFPTVLVASSAHAASAARASAPRW
jgi:hypothetical protein